jgi:hypothetical protein
MIISKTSRGIAKGFRTMASGVVRIGVDEKPLIVSRKSTTWGFNAPGR